MRKRLQEMRKQVLTQEELADRIGCANIHISKFENAKNSCSLDFAFRYSHEIGYNIDPTGLVKQAFRNMVYISIDHVIDCTRQLKIVFDPDNLFEVSE